MTPTSNETSELVGSDVNYFVRYMTMHRRREQTRRLVLLASFLAPIILGAFYYLFLAAPMYRSEARFAVRGVELPQAGAGAAGRMGGASALVGFVDGYAVRDFLESRDAMDRLSKQMDLADAIARPVIDPFVRSPAKLTIDDLYAAYRAFVSVRFHVTEQIIVLDVLSFQPQKAVEISANLLKLSDEFVSTMNQRGLEDSLKVANHEVSLAQHRAAQARADIAAWRAKNAGFDPTADAAVLTNVISQLESQISATETSLAALPERSPLRASTAAQLATLRARVAETRTRLGGRPDAVSAGHAEFEALKTKQDFAEASLNSARQSLDHARQSISRQQKYIGVVAQPMQDGVPARPSLWIVLILSVLSGGTVSAIAAAALAFMPRRPPLNAS